MAKTNPGGEGMKQQHCGKLTAEANGTKKEAKENKWRSESSGVGECGGGLDNELDSWPVIWL